MNLGDKRNLQKLLVMKKKLHCIFSLWLVLLTAPFAYSQNVSLTSDGSAPDPSAVLDLSNITTGGFLLPCMTTAQMYAQLPNGGAYPNSMLVFCTDDNCFWSYYNNGGTKTWFNDYCLCSAAPSTPGAITGATTYSSGASETYSVTAVSGATSYNWTVPTGSIITAGATTNSITVTMGSSSGNVTCTASNSCGTSAASTLAVSPCTPVITKDVTAKSNANSNSFNITTSGTNELVIISCNGYNNSNPVSFSGSVAITGGWTGAATSYGTVSTNKAEVAIYWFVAPTAATYTVTVTETGYSYYYNFGVALTGFCNTPSISDFVASNTTTTNCNCSTVSTTLTESANSYAIGSTSSYWDNSSSTPTWTNLTAAGFYGVYDGSADDYGISGQAISTSSTSTITATYSGKTSDAVLYLIDIL